MVGEGKVSSSDNGKLTVLNEQIYGACGLKEKPLETVSGVVGAEEVKGSISSDLCLSLQPQFRALLSPSLLVLQPNLPPLASEMCQALPFLTQDFCFAILSTCMFPSSTPTLPDVHNRN